jgi:uncharacterized protein (DUF488 family)
VRGERRVAADAYDGMYGSPRYNLPVRIWTIGHSTRSLEDFLDLLRAFEIEALVDVRHYPGSRRLPHFHRDALAEALPVAGIEYRHVVSLGGRRKPSPDSPNTAWRSAQFRGYADYMATGEFRAGVDELLALAATRPTAMMCAEAVWWRCHRSLVSDWLKVRDHEVLHIVGPRKIEPHPYTSAASIVDGALSYAAPDEEPRLL